MRKNVFKKTPLARLCFLLSIFSFIWKLDRATIIPSFCLQSRNSLLGIRIRLIMVYVWLYLKTLALRIYAVPEWREIDQVVWIKMKTVGHNKPIGVLSLLGDKPQLWHNLKPLPSCIQPHVYLQFGKITQRLYLQIYLEFRPDVPFVYVVNFKIN